MMANYVVVMSHWDLAASCRQPWHKRVSVIGPEPPSARTHLNPASDFVGKLALLAFLKIDSITRSGTKQSSTFKRRKQRTRYIPDEQHPSNRIRISLRREV